MDTRDTGLRFLCRRESRITLAVVAGLLLLGGKFISEWRTATIESPKLFGSGTTRKSHRLGFRRVNGGLTYRDYRDGAIEIDKDQELAALFDTTLTLRTLMIILLAVAGPLCVFWSIFAPGLSRGPPTLAAILRWVGTTTLIGLGLVAILFTHTGFVGNWEANLGWPAATLSSNSLGLSFWLVFTASLAGSSVFVAATFLGLFRRAVTTRSAAPNAPRAEQVAEPRPPPPDAPTKPAAASAPDTTPRSPLVQWGLLAVAVIVIIAWSINSWRSLTTSSSASLFNGRASTDAVSRSDFGLFSAKTKSSSRERGPYLEGGSRSSQKEGDEPYEYLEYRFIERRKFEVAGSVATTRTYAFLLACLLVLTIAATLLTVVLPRMRYVSARNRFRLMVAVLASSTALLLLVVLFTQTGYVGRDLPSGRRGNMTASNSLGVSFWLTVTAALLGAGLGVKEIRRLRREKATAAAATQRHVVSATPIDRPPEPAAEVPTPQTPPDEPE